MQDGRKCDDKLLLHGLWKENEEIEPSKRSDRSRKKTQFINSYDHELRWSH